jgi:hypothetical protein
MDDGRTQTSARLGVAILLAAALALAGCGLNEADGKVASTDGKEDGTSSTSAPGMRKPKSLCERVPHETVETLSQLKLDPGNPSERYDYPECNWRRRGADVAVTASLQPKLSQRDFRERFGGEDTEEIPDLGELAIWHETLGRVAVLADEGAFEVTIYNYDVTKDVIKDADIELIRILMETTEVPDTTTTTASTEPVEVTGLCARFPRELVEKESGLNLDPGTAAGGDSSDNSCVFRERAQGVAVDIQLFDPDSFDMSVLTDVVDNDEAGVPSKISLVSRVIYAETDEGVLSIQILNFDQTEDQFQAAAITLVKEFVASS